MSQKLWLHSLKQHQYFAKEIDFGSIGIERLTYAENAMHAKRLP